MKRLIYITPLLLLATVSCRDFHVNFVGDSILAEVDGKHFMESELTTLVPKEYRGEDSVAFVEAYIDKWIIKQVKLREAEKVFVGTEADVEALLEEYRQLLLIKRLDERHIRTSMDTVYTDQQILQYYQGHSSNFKLNGKIAKGEVLRIPHGSDQTKKLKALMSSDGESKRADVRSISEKNGFEFIDLSSSWVDANEILDLLPLVRGEQTDKLLSERGLHSMSDESYDYLYQIFDNREVGDVAPLEWVSSTIRTILRTERQQALIKSNEESLYGEALLEGVVKRQYKDRKAKKEAEEAAAAQRDEKQTEE